MSSKIERAIAAAQAAAYDAGAVSWHGEQLAPEARHLTTPSFSGYNAPKYRERVIKYRDDLYKRVVYPSGYGAAKDGDFAPEELPEGKIPENVRRAKKAIEAYALCNDWTYWATFTLRPGKYKTRLDLASFRRDVMQLLRNVRRETGGVVAALLVPELHRNLDGWHMHGLLRLPADQLRQFEIAETLPLKLKERIATGKTLYDWPRYRDAFGWVCMEPLENRDAAARYITKYVTKGLNDRETAEKMTKGQHLYYVTRGLKRPEVLYDLRCDVLEGTVQPVIVGAETVTVWDKDRHKVEWSYNYPGGEVEWLRPAPDGERSDRRRQAAQARSLESNHGAPGAAPGSGAFRAALAALAAACSYDAVNAVLYKHAGGAWARLTISEIQCLHAAADDLRQRIREGGDFGDRSET